MSCSQSIVDIEVIQLILHGDEDKDMNEFLNNPILNGNTGFTLTWMQPVDWKELSFT